MAPIKVSSASVDYTELPGAFKQGDCEHVDVKGGVSESLGCCNDFEYLKGKPKQFKCGTCEYFSGGKEPNYLYGG